MIKVILCFTMIFNIIAAETDQFISWGHELLDSKEAVNNYINLNMREALALKATQKKKNCYGVATQLMRPMRQNFKQKIEQWADSSKEVDQFPKDDVTPREYLDASIMKSSYWPFNMDVFYIPNRVEITARTLNVNGVYLGSDKLGHFISFGVRYREKYLKALKKGATEKEAINQAILFGVETEEGVVGKFATGIFSNGDLESNYQGFLFQISLCKSDSDFKIVGEKGNWRVTGNFQIEEYINPNWDESFNESIYAPRRFKETREHLKKYCDKKELAFERFTYYQSILNESYSTRFVKELKLEDPYPFSLEGVCNSR